MFNPQQTVKKELIEEDKFENLEDDVQNFILQSSKQSAIDSH